VVGAKNTKTAIDTAELVRDKSFKTKTYKSELSKGLRITTDENTLGDYHQSLVCSLPPLKRIPILRLYGRSHVPA
jgi:hypothetical protein